MASAVLMGGCAQQQPQRVNVVPLFDLEIAHAPAQPRGWGRMYISAGTAAGEQLAATRQVGPVFINQQRVGAVGKDEYFIVDLLPGTYEAHCGPQNAGNTQVEKLTFTVKPDELRYFSCDIDPLSAKAGGSTLGNWLGSAPSKAYLAEYPSNQVGARLTEYRQFK